MGRIEDRLRAMGLELPPAPKPVAAYVPAVVSGELVFVSGQIPVLPSKPGDAGGSGAGPNLMSRGRVPGEVTPEEARKAARQCVLNGLAAAKAALGGDLDRVRRVVRVGVFVASEPTFFDQPKVADGASELLQELFPGEPGEGGHVRAAVGSVALPLGVPVEVEMILAIST